MGIMGPSVGRNFARHVLIELALCVQWMSFVNGGQGEDGDVVDGDGTSAKPVQPVKIHFEDPGGSLFLDRFFQVVTVILLLLVLLIFGFTLLSALMYCCHTKGKH